MALWINPKKGKQEYQASYEFIKGDRLFVLTNMKSKKRTEFSSFQAAKQLGWKKK